MKLGFKHEPTGTLLSLDVGNKRVISISTMSGGVLKYGTLNDLKYSQVGILKEFPDLKDKEWVEMKRLAIERFKCNLLGMHSDEEVKAYIVKDLKKYGYKLYLEQKKGFRPRQCQA